MNWRDMTVSDIEAHNAKVARDAQAAHTNPSPARKPSEENGGMGPRLRANGPKTDFKPEKTSKPRRATEMNATERELLAMLKEKFPGARAILWEAYTLKLAHRTTYSPDFAVIHGSGGLGRHGEIEFWECKGSYIFDKALTKPKIAAEMFPQHKFTLAQKTKMGWKYTELPSRNS